MRSFEISMAGFIDHAHSALAKPQLKLVFAFEQRFADEGVRGSLTIFRAILYVVRITTLTGLALSHSSKIELSVSDTLCIWQSSKPVAWIIESRHNTTG
jgi:hypothetical protein